MKERTTAWILAVALVMGISGLCRANSLVESFVVYDLELDEEDNRFSVYATVSANDINPDDPNQGLQGYALSLAGLNSITGDTVKNASPIGSFSSIPVVGFTGFREVMDPRNDETIGVSAIQDFGDGPGVLDSIVFGFGQEAGNLRDRFGDGLAYEPDPDGDYERRILLVTGTYPDGTPPHWDTNDLGNRFAASLYSSVSRSTKPGDSFALMDVSVDPANPNRIRLSGVDTTIPEPATVLLLGPTVLWMAMRRRRMA